MIEQGALTINGIQDIAATTIQKCWRGYQVRKGFEDRKPLLVKHKKTLKGKKRASAAEQKRSVDLPGNQSPRSVSPRYFKLFHSVPLRVALRVPVRVPVRVLVRVRVRVPVRFPVRVRVRVPVRFPVHLPVRFLVRVPVPVSLRVLVRVPVRVVRVPARVSVRVLGRFSACSCACFSAFSCACSSACSCASLSVCSWACRLLHDRISRGMGQKTCGKGKWRGREIVFPFVFSVAVCACSLVRISCYVEAWWPIG